MDSLKNMNDAIMYIEDHLTDEIDVKEVARRALCSEFHFKKMFSLLAGIPLSEYIRRRRLTLAAFELTHNQMKVIDAAVTFGYSSADSFTRAFQQLHGITPSEAKQNGQSLKAFPPMTFQLTIKGGSEMNYRIEEKAPFTIIGLMKRVPIVFQGENPDITAMSKSITPEMIHQLKQRSNIQPKGIISASTNFSEERMEEKGGLDHYIGVATTRDCPENFSQLEVPALTWAVFESVGPFPNKLQETWGRIYSEWFPSSSYQQVEGPEILWNENNNYSSPTFRSEIWIPIQKK